MKPSIRPVLDLGKERCQFLLIQLSLGAYSSTDIQGKWADFLDRLSRVRGMDATGKKDRNLNLFPDLATQPPIMLAPGSAQLFHRERRVAGVEENRIHKRLDGQGLVERFETNHVNHLHDRDSRQVPLQILVGTPREPIANLQSIGPTATLLANYRWNVLGRSQKKGRNRGRHLGRDFSDR